MHRAPSQALPGHAADCHMHVFGPFDRYPLAAERACNVPEAPLDAGELLDVFIEAVPDAETRRAILAANPARLYGFDR